MSTSTVVTNTQPASDKIYASFGYRALAYLVDFIILFQIKIVFLILLIPIILLINGPDIITSIQDCFDSVTYYSEPISIQQSYLNTFNTPETFFQEQLLPNENQKTVQECVTEIISTTTKIQITVIILSIILSIVTGWLYYAFCESYKWQGTVGKLIFKLKVMNNNFQRISFLKASCRYFAKFPSLLTLGIGYLLPIFTEKKQALHDLVTNCVVVQNNPQPNQPSPETIRN